jgi:hypothetical protein
MYQPTQNANVAEHVGVFDHIGFSDFAGLPPRAPLGPLRGCPRYTSDNSVTIGSHAQAVLKFDSDHVNLGRSEMEPHVLI